MNNEHSEIIKQFEDMISVEKDIDKRKKLIDEKELYLKEHRINHQYKQVTETIAEIEMTKNLNFGHASAAYIQSIIDENDAYMEAAKHPMMFINPAFNRVVPFFRKNLVLIGGKTGEGKSTTVANVIFAMIGQIINGKLPRILVLTNEEKPEDVYNRVTCMIKGWRYVDHDQFTDEQRATFREMIPKLARFIVVVGDTYEGVKGTTTTFEGIRGVLDNILKNDTPYDAILIDYYQKIRRSKNDERLDEYAVQRKLSDMLDTYKNQLPAPIILLAQVKPPDEASTPFEIRIKGTKMICEAATMIMEMVAHRDDLATEWIVHKSRFTSAVGKTFLTGFDKGRYVEYDSAFKQKVADYKHDKMMKDMDKKSAIKPKEEVDGNNPKSSRSEQAKS